VNVACPDAFSEALPISRAPSKKLTVPKGTAASFEDVSITVAVNATACPSTDGFVPETSVVDVVAGFTVCPPLSVPLLFVKFPSLFT
jgi:hypothetical protein